jgi:hypothetical protein
LKCLRFAAPFAVMQIALHELGDRDRLGCDVRPAVARGQRFTFRLLASFRVANVPRERRSVEPSAFATTTA